MSFHKVENAICEQIKASLIEQYVAHFDEQPNVEILDSIEYMAKEKAKDCEMPTSQGFENLFETLLDDIEFDNLRNEQ